MTRLLIVEDDAGLRETLAVALEGDYELSFAASTAEAQACLRQAPADLLLLDQRLPGQSGTEWLAAMAENLPPAVILLSANADPELARRALRLGAVDCLSKPFDLGLLKAKLREAAAQPRTGRAPLEDPFGLVAARHLAGAIEGSKTSLEADLGQLMRQLAQDALQASGGEPAQAAKRLGISLEELKALL
jgi:DNA-binding NtrC family response regulator